MSSRLKKISLKNEVRKARIDAQMIALYFDEYDLTHHFIAYVKALAKGEEKPKKLKIDE